MIIMKRDDCDLELLVMPGASTLKVSIDIKETVGFASDKTDSTVMGSLLRDIQET